MGKKILVVLTSVDTIPVANKPTGWYLPELAHPYKVLVESGFTEIDIISPEGGKAPLDPGSVDAFKDDADCQWFLKDATAQSRVTNTKTPDQVKACDYSAVMYPGGHGPMFDLASDPKIAQLTAAIYENGGVVAAVCHGPAGLIPVKLSNGDPIVKGKVVTSFTNAEEKAVQLVEFMPFSLEKRLRDQGCTFKEEPIFKENLVVDGRLITGQNPASSAAMGKAMVNLLK